MIEFADILIQMIQSHGVIAVILAMMIEEILVPIPSPVIPMTAGVLLVTADGFLGGLIQLIFLIVIPGSIASVIASFFGYSIGYFGGKPAIERYGSYIGVEYSELEELKEHLTSGREHYYIAFFRAVPVVPLSLIDGASGFFGIGWKKYALWSFLGMIVRNFTLGFIGWQMQEGVRFLASSIDTVSSFVFVFSVIALGLWLVERNADRIYNRIFRVLK